jgi:hypothetical protein
MLKEYHKIETIFERDDNTKKLNENKYRNETVEFLKDLEWEFTEKIDGTNIRIYWDRHKVQYFGRTDIAQIPSQLLNVLLEKFGGDTNEEMFEQLFGDKEVMLIGEGYGAKIQSGGDYRSDNSFALFDVIIDDIFLNRESVQSIANSLNIETAPVVFYGNLQKGIDYVKTKPGSLIGTAKMEGLVARPKQELLDRLGNRVIVKIKVKDFE